MTDIKIKRYADKENLKKLVKYSKDTFANKSEVNEKFYTKEQIDSKFEEVSGGTGDNYYTKSEIDTKLTSKANTSDLSTVATTGSYNDLLDKPTSFDVDLDNYYTKEQIDSMLESGSGGTGGGGEVGDATIKINYGSTNLGSFTTNQSADAIVDIRPINTLISENYYTKNQIDILLKKVIVNQKVLGGAIYDSNIDEYNNETEQTMKTVSAVVEPTSVNAAYTIVENSDTVEEL